MSAPDPAPAASPGDERERLTLGSRERRLLSETVQVEEELVPSFVRPLLGIAALTVLGFFVWASLTRVTEVARAPGEIIPIGKIKVVQHLDGGAVESIHVEERMLVEAGQVLVRMDGAQALAELRQMEARHVGLRLRAERLGAFADRRQPNLASVAGKHGSLLSDQRELLRTQIETRDSTLAILDRQIDQRSRRIVQLTQLLAGAKEQQIHADELARMREDLAARQLINRSVLLETRRAKVTADGEVGRLTQEIDVTRQELAEFQNRRADMSNQLRRDALNEMGTARNEMAEVEQSIERLKARVGRLVVRSPERGFVQDLKVQTVGQVIQPGGLLMQIVPDQSPLEAEIRIAPRDVGFARVGQPVNMRVTTYDYARFGFATGKLKRISASSVTGDDNKPYFRGWVLLDHPWVGNVPGRYMLQAGMGLEAEIVTGEKSLIVYLSKPIIDVVSRSFHER
jgi:HlyD family type I secretion membrane fusion protein